MLPCVSRGFTGSATFYEPSTGELVDFSINISNIYLIFLYLAAGNFTLVHHSTGETVTGPWFGIFKPVIHNEPTPPGQPLSYTSCGGMGRGWILGPARFLQGFDWSVWGQGTSGYCWGK